MRLRLLPLLLVLGASCRPAGAAEVSRPITRAHASALVSQIGPVISAPRGENFGRRLADAVAGSALVAGATPAQVEAAALMRRAALDPESSAAIARELSLLDPAAAEAFLAAAVVMKTEPEQAAAFERGLSARLAKLTAAGTDDAKALLDLWYTNAPGATAGAVVAAISQPHALPPAAVLKRSEARPPQTRTEVPLPNDRNAANRDDALARALESLALENACPLGDCHNNVKKLLDRVLRDQPDFPLSKANVLLIDRNGERYREEADLALLEVKDIGAKTYGFHFALEHEGRVYDPTFSGPAGLPVRDYFSRMFVLSAAKPLAVTDPDASRALTDRLERQILRWARRQTLDDLRVRVISAKEYVDSLHAQLVRRHIAAAEGIPAVAASTYLGLASTKRALAPASAPSSYQIGGLTVNYDPERVEAGAVRQVANAVSVRQPGEEYATDYNRTDRGLAQLSEGFYGPRLLDITELKRITDAGGVILDMAGADGLFVQELREKHGIPAYTLDIAPGSVARDHLNMDLRHLPAKSVRLKPALEEKHFLWGDAVNTPLADESVRLIYDTYGVIEYNLHAKGQTVVKRALSEWRRILEPGGLIRFAPVDSNQRKMIKALAASVGLEMTAFEKPFPTSENCAVELRKPDPSRPELSRELAEREAAHEAEVVLAVHKHAVMMREMRSPRKLILASGEATLGPAPLGDGYAEKARLLRVSEAVRTPPDSTSTYGLKTERAGKDAASAATLEAAFHAGLEAEGGWALVDPLARWSGLANRQLDRAPEALPDILGKEATGFVHDTAHDAFVVYRGRVERVFLTADQDRYDGAYAEIRLSDRLITVEITRDLKDMAVRGQPQRAPAAPAVAAAAAEQALSTVAETVTAPFWARWLRPTK